MTQPETLPSAPTRARRPESARRAPAPRGASVVPPCCPPGDLPECLVEHKCHQSLYDSVFCAVTDLAGGHPAIHPSRLQRFCYRVAWSALGGIVSRYPCIVFMMIPATGKNNIGAAPK